MSIVGAVDSSMAFMKSSVLSNTELSDLGFWASFEK
jgi:hypothetical protein